MRTMAMFGLVSVLGVTGCAAPERLGVTSMQPQSVRETSSIHLGHTLVLDAQVDPAAGVHVVHDGDGIAVHFAHLGSLDRLHPSWVETETQADHADDAAVSASAPPSALRVEIDGGRHFIAFWRSGDGEGGHRAMAQAFNADDTSPRGASVAVSPSNADVQGPLSAVSYDGHHVVVAFAAVTNSALAAYAVPLESL